MQILSFFHLNDNTLDCPFGQPRHDPFHKLRPFINLLEKKFQELYYPKKELSLDEATCPFKGRLKFLTCNPDKPYKWGIKIYQVCESASGYCFSLKVATGSDHSSQNKTYV